MSAPPAGPVLVVCTGNICRSPAAELLLRAGLGADGPEVVSAGTAARVGEPVAPPMARLLSARGIDAQGFAARQLAPPLLRSAGLVLTMTAAQRSAVVGQAPAVVRRTFTLRELARLARAAEAGTDVPAGGDPATRLAALVAVAPALRARHTGPRADDVEDPYGRSEEVFTRVLAEIDAAVTDVLSVLVPATTRTA